MNHSQKLHKLNERLKRLSSILSSLVHSNGSVAHIRCIYENLGDIAVAKAIGVLLSKIVLIDYSYSSKVKTMEKLLKKNLCKYACLGGGTLIFAPHNIGWSLSLKGAVNTKMNLLFTFGTGVRDPEFFKDISNDGISEWCEYLRKFSLISVRGNLSREMLKSKGIEDVKVIGDPALIYSRESIMPKRYFKKIGINISKNFQSYGGHEDRAFEVLKNLIARLVKDGWKVTLFPSCGEDVLLSQHICKEKKNKNITIHKQYWNIDSFLDILEEQDIFIGIKLHPVILAFCTYTPSLMIAYQPKCYDFMETMGMEEFTFRSDRLNTDLLLDKIDYLYNNIETIQERQYRSCQDFKQRLISFKDEVYNLIDKV